MEVSRSEWLRRMKFRFPGTARQQTEPLARRIDFVTGDIITEINVEDNPDVKDDTFAPFLKLIVPQRECTTIKMSKTEVGPKCMRELGSLANGTLHFLHLSALTEKWTWTEMLDELANGFGGGVCSLEELDLSANPSMGSQDAENRLNEALSTIFQSAKRLHDLKLSGCALKLPPAAGCFVRARLLDISNNNFDGTVVRIAPGADVSVLEQLSCKSSGTICIEGIENCVNLRVLDLSGTVTSDGTLEGVARLTATSSKLTDVLVSGSRGNASPLLEVMAGARTSVTALDVSSCSLGDVPMSTWEKIQELSNMSHVKVLRMHDTGITSGVVEVLASEAALQGITEFDVSANNLRGLPQEKFKAIVQFPKLKVLKIGNASLEQDSTEGAGLVVKSRLHSLHDGSDLQGSSVADSFPKNRFSQDDHKMLSQLKLVPGDMTVQMKGSTAFHPPVATKPDVTVTMSAEEYEAYTYWKETIWQQPHQQQAMASSHHLGSHTHPGFTGRQRWAHSGGR